MRNLWRKSPALLRLAGLGASVALVAGVVVIAPPAQAVATGASISKSQWLVGSSTAVTVSWTNSSTSISSVMVRSPWPWGATWASTDNANATGGAASGSQTLSCPKGIVFSISNATLTGSFNPSCQFRNEANWKGFYISGSGLSVAAGATISVSLPAGLVIAPSSPRTDTWLVGIYDNNFLSGIQAEVATTAYSLQGDAPLVTIDFDANGGTCQTAKATGYASTWAKAPSASDCSKPGAQFIGWNTSADGSGIGIQPEGWINFTSDNRVYAQYFAPRTPAAPTNVTAVPSRNQVKVSWQAPADPGSAPVAVYLAEATPSGKICITRLSDADMLSCTFDLPATNTKYSFVVQALNDVGWGNFSTESTAVSPYGFGEITASRPNILLGLGGSKVEASGSAPGLAGKAVNAEYKVGSESAWTTQANAATVNAQGKFSWSRKFGPLQNRKNVTVRFTYGSDAVSGSYVLARGSEAGSLTAPRNIKIENDVNRVRVNWDPPKFDGGEKIIGYTICAKANGSLCRNVPAEGRGVFQNLATGREYTITVAARTATRTGPEATAKQKVSPVEASVRITRRLGQEIRGEAEASGFKTGAKFRLEAAVAVPGEPASNWRWEELLSFTGKGNENRGFAQELGSSYEGEALAVRLVTPNGSVYSRLSRP